MLAIPALAKTGVFDCAKAVFGDIGPAFYGLRTTILTLLLMALLRIKRPEALKEHAPPAVEVAYRTFERWRQENFFKYLREEYALDALADHQLEPADPTRTVTNPALYAVDHTLRQARLELQRLSSQYGLDALANIEAKRRTMRGFKIASSAVGRIVAAAERRVARLERRRSRLPKRVPVALVVDGQVVQLSTQRKHLTNCLKMVAYQAALASAADLVVTETELRVVLAPMSSPHRTKAISALCNELNVASTTFPGSKLRLRPAPRRARRLAAAHAPQGVGPPGGLRCNFSGVSIV